MDGFLLIDKPSGWTSFDVVAKVRNLTNSPDKTSDRTINRDSSPKKKIKVGHTGTLDPLATGLMIVVVGSYTKRAEEFSKLDKVYEVTMKLGQVSTTGDSEGELSIPDYSKYSPLSREVFTELTDKIPDVLQKFTGEILQTPPAFSAIKVGGQRAYKLARAGKEVKLEPRKVTIYEITDVNYEYPMLQFTTKVSSGTYIRSLVEDIGKELGTGAYMTDLCRTQVGAYNIQDAMQVGNLNSEKIQDKVQLA